MDDGVVAELLVKLQSDKDPNSLIKIIEATHRGHRKATDRCVPANDGDAGASQAATDFHAEPRTVAPHERIARRCP